MAKRSWLESMRNAALLGLMQSSLETGARRTDRYTLFRLTGAILGRSVALFGIYWPLRCEGRLEGLGRFPAFPSFTVLSTRWKETRLKGV